MQLDDNPEEAEIEPALDKVVRKKKEKGKKEKDLKKVTLHEDIDCVMSKEKLDAFFGKNNWKKIQVEKIYKLEHIPECFKAVTYHVSVYASKDATDGRMIRADKPIELLQKSIATPSLVASLMMAKYINGVPLYRQEQTYAFNEIMISRITMARWIIQVADLYFKPFFELMKSKLLLHSIIQADETPFQVTKDGRKAGSKSYMWVYRTNPEETDERIVLYNYSSTRSHENLKGFLQEYNGLIVCDGYQAYHKLENDQPARYKVCGCWVHAKRKFSDVVKVTSTDKKSKETRVHKVANKGVKLIGKIYEAEHEIEKTNLSLDEKKRLRQEKVKPLVDKFFEWAKENAPLFDEKSGNGKALKYAINQEKYLRAFLDEPLAPLDNNASERAIRPFTVGRRNWIQIDTPRGAEASALVYSIAETAKANNLHPYQYFKYLMEEIPKYVISNQPIPETLLPWSETLPSIIHKPKR